MYILSLSLSIYIYIYIYIYREREREKIEDKVPEFGIGRPNERQKKKRDGKTVCDCVWERGGEIKGRNRQRRRQTK